MVFIHITEPAHNLSRHLTPDIVVILEGIRQ